MKSALPRLRLPSVAPSASQKRLAAYLVGAVVSFIAGSTAPPHGWWETLKFASGMIGAMATTYRAFIDLVQGRQTPPPDSTPETAAADKQASDSQAAGAPAAPDSAPAGGAPQ